VTSSGVNALMLAMQRFVGAGDEVVAVVPISSRPGSRDAKPAAIIISLAAHAASEHDAGWFHRRSQVNAEICTDNGAMIALAAAMRLERGIAVPSSGHAFDVLPRWPLLAT